MEFGDLHILDANNSLCTIKAHDKLTGQKPKREKPVKEIADLRVFWANDPALDFESKPVSSFQSQEICCSQSYLPQHHRKDLYDFVCGNITLFVTENRLEKSLKN
ncbi:hypothetical protein ACLOJK_028348 [Asimina triloba]